MSFNDNYSICSNLNITSFVVFIFCAQTSKYCQITQKCQLKKLKDNLIEHCRQFYLELKEINNNCGKGVPLMCRYCYVSQSDSKVLTTQMSYFYSDYCRTHTHTRVRRTKFSFHSKTFIVLLERVQQSYDLYRIYKEKESQYFTLRS